MMQAPGRTASVLFVAALVWGLVLASPRAGWAQASVARPSAPSARTEFERGRASYRQGRYAEAAAAFQEAHSIEPAPGLLLNMALAYDRLGDLSAARRMLERFLAEVGGDARYAEDRRRAEALLGQVRLRAPTPVAIDSAPPGARVFVDSVRLGALGTTPFATELAVGAHTVILDLDGHATEERSIRVSPGEPVHLAVSLRRADGRIRVSGVPDGAVLSVDGRATPMRPSEPLLLAAGHRRIALAAPGRLTLQHDVQVRENRIVDLDVELGSPRSYRTVAWVLGGAAALLGAGAAYFAWQAGQSAREIEAAGGGGSQVEWTAQLQAIEDAGLRSQWIAVAGAAAAGTALVAAVVAWLAEPRHRPSVNERLVRLGPWRWASVAVEGTF